MLENMFIILGIGIYLLFIGSMMDIKAKGYSAMFFTVLYKVIPLVSGIYLVMYSLIVMDIVMEAI